MKLNRVVYFSFFVLGLHLSFFQGLVQVIVTHFNRGIFYIGLFASLHFLGIIFSALLTGYLGDKKGKRIVITSSQLFTIVGTLMIFTCNNIMLITIGIFLSGYAFGALEVNLTSVLADTNSNQDKAINYSQFFLGIGTIIAPLILLANVNNYWESVFFALCLLYIVSFLWFLKNSSSLSKPTENTQNDTLPFHWNAPLVALCISIALYVGLEEGMAFWIVTYFNKIFHNPRSGTLALSLYWGGLTLGRYLIIRLSRFQNKSIWICLAISFISTVIIFMSSSFVMNIICFAYVGLGFAPIWPYIASRAIEKQPMYSGTIMGIMMLFSSIGGLIYPLIMGLVSNVNNFNSAILCINLGVIVLSFLMYLYTRKPSCNHNTISC